MLTPKEIAYAVTKALDEKKGMNIKLLKIDKVSSLADYMEPNRDFPGVEELRRLAYTDLDQALEMGLEMTLALLREQGREISPESGQALQWLRDQK